MPIQCFAGAKLSLQCSQGATYFSQLDECVSAELTASLEFLQAFLLENICFGGSIQNLADLNALRFCTSIVGELLITLNEPSADFSAVFDINVIQGTVHDGQNFR